MNRGAASKARGSGISVDCRPNLFRDAVRSLRRSAGMLVYVLRLALLAGCGGDSSQTPAGPGTDQPGDVQPVITTFADTSLEQAVRQTLAQPSGNLSVANLRSLTTLSAVGRTIADLRGIEQLDSLSTLDLTGNRIADLTPLGTLARLTFLELSNNQVVDLTPLAGLEELQYLGLFQNQVRDLTALLGLAELKSVELSGNPLDSVSRQEQLPVLNGRGVQVGFMEYATVEDTVRSWPGKIAFVRNRSEDLYVLSADSVEAVNLTGSLDLKVLAPAWSPDGTRISFFSDRDNRFFDIFTMNIDGSQLLNLTNNSKTDTNPDWSPDGTRIAFSSDREGNYDIFVMRSDGSEVINLTRDHLDTDFQPAWSPDGTRIAFVSQRRAHPSDPRPHLRVYVMNVDGSHLAPLTDKAPDHDEMYPAWSPDGNKIALDKGFESNGEIYLVEVASQTRINLTQSVASEHHPSWSPDGSWIVFAVHMDDWQLCLIDLERQERLQLTPRGTYDDHPAWSR